MQHATYYVKARMVSNLANLSVNLATCLLVSACTLFYIKSGAEATALLPVVCIIIAVAGLSVVAVIATALELVNLLGWCILYKVETVVAIILVCHTARAHNQCDG